MNRREYQAYTALRDTARMQHAIAAYDKRIAWDAARERIARLAIVAIAGFLSVFLFYVATAT